MPSLLVTNDFPPKHGGIQSYLYDLWRRLPPDETTVPLASPPKSTCWMPELVTLVVSAVPPDRISSALPLVTTTPELTTPEDTNVVVMAHLNVYAPPIPGKRPSR